MGRKKKSTTEIENEIELQENAANEIELQEIVAIEAEQAESKWSDPAIIGEDESLATENSHTYYLNNGTMKSVISAAPADSGVAALALSDTDSNNIQIGNGSHPNSAQRK